MTVKPDLDRRSLLALTAAATATVESAGSAETAAAQAKPSDIVLMNGSELSNAIKATRVPCAEVMNALSRPHRAFESAVCNLLMLTIRQRAGWKRDDRFCWADELGG